VSLWFRTYSSSSSEQLQLNPNYLYLCVLSLPTGRQASLRGKGKKLQLAFAVAVKTLTCLGVLGALVVKRQWPESGRQSPVAVKTLNDWCSLCTPRLCGEIILNTIFC
jgi:hypothetical protein